MDSQAPLTRIDHDGAGGRWTLWRRPPAPALAPYVTGLQGYVEAGTRPLWRDELPSGSVHLIIVLEHGFMLTGADGPHRLDGSFVAGLHRAPSRVGSRGAAACMEVTFTPLGARRFLRTEMADLTDRVVRLDALNAAGAQTLEDRLAATATWDRRFDILESRLATRIQEAPDDDPRVLAAWRALSAADGKIGISRLATRLDVSRKHLNTLFKRQIGVPPKTFARLVRFANTVSALDCGAVHADGTLADLAARCGYADQAHLNREVRNFAGAPPTALMRRIADSGMGALSADR